MVELLGERQAGLPKRLPSSRRHILLSFRGVPQEKQVLELKSRGAVVTGYVPGGGLIVAASEDTSLADLDLTDTSSLAPSQKISADLHPEATAFLAAFHPDVDAADARLLLHEARLQEHYHPDVLPHDFLVYGDKAGAARLAEWDEVAYIYPVSPTMLNGGRLQACPGPLTPYGQVGQYIATAGDGWDGAGTGTADLGYYLGTLASRLPRLNVQTEILRALGTWSKYVQVNFQPAASPSGPRTISILFASGAHGDPYPFDGPGQTLAHTFYPAPPNPETIAGDMHFDDTENWGFGQGIDLFSVALHEAGHALGLGHSDKPGDVMYPYYSQAADLTADDVAAIRLLYAARDGAPTPTPTPSDPTTPTPPTNPTPPSPPPTKPPASPQPTDTVAPVVKITTPWAATVLTYEEALAFAGTATDKVGVAKVTWTDSLGNTGPAAGTTIWKIAAIPLRVGTNTITIRAYDAAGNAGKRVVVITRKKK